VTGTQRPLPLSVTAVPSSELVDITVTDPSPAQAALIANAIMSTFIAQVTQQNTDRINQAGAPL
jgi:capsular polysaccharide biosynthesis protein